MKIKLLNIALPLILLLDSCQPLKTSPEEISLHPSNLKTYSGPLEEILEVEKIVALETNPDVLLGSIWGFAQSETGILIRDKGNKRLFVFNADGRMKSKIQKEGKGPGEYNEIFGQDWIPSKNGAGDEIVVSDVYGRKLIFYSADGEFISESKIPWSLHNIAALSADIILCHQGRFGQMGSNSLEGFQLRALNRKGETLKGYFPYNIPIQFELGTGFSQGIDGDGRSYYKQLDPIIYQIKTELKLDTIWKFDFGSFNPDTSRLLISGMEGIQNLQKMSKTNPFLYISGMVQSTNNLLVTFYHNKTAYNNFINNKSRNIQSLAADSLNRIGKWRSFPVYAPDWSFGESFIYELSAFGWMELLEDMDEESKDYMRKKVPGFKETEGLSENDNPVLVYYTIKDF